MVWEGGDGCAERGVGREGGELVEEDGLVNHVERERKRERKEMVVVYVWRLCLYRLGL